MKLSQWFRRGATISRDVEVAFSRDPKKVKRRLGNKLKGRLLARIGFWRLLWK